MHLTKKRRRDGRGIIKYKKTPPSAKLVIKTSYTPQLSNITTHYNQVFFFVVSPPIG